MLTYVREAGKVDAVARFNRDVLACTVNHEARARVGRVFVVYLAIGLVASLSGVVVACIENDYRKFVGSNSAVIVCIVLVKIDIKVARFNYIVNSLLRGALVGKSFDINVIS